MLSRISCSSTAHSRDSSASLSQRGPALLTARSWRSVSPSCERTRRIAARRGLLRYHRRSPDRARSGKASWSSGLPLWCCNTLFARVFLTFCSLASCRAASALLLEHPLPALLQRRATAFPLLFQEGTHGLDVL